MRIAESRKSCAPFIAFFAMSGRCDKIVAGRGWATPSGRKRFRKAESPPGAPCLDSQTWDTLNPDAPNGDVLAMTDAAMGTWSYSYDDFNRLTGGTVTLTVNGTQIATANYGGGSTPASIASALVSAGSSNGLVTLSASGSSLTMLADGDGTVTDYSYALNIASSQATAFPSASFSGSPGAGSLEGGTDVPLYTWSINSYAPNGDVLGMTDAAMGAWSYSYDGFNRLTGGSATAGVDAGLALGWT